MPSERLPDVSVIVPTHDRSALLRRLLSSLSQQTTPAERFEVVAIDDGSTDDTIEVLSDAVRVLPTLRWDTFDPGRGPAAARNRGWELARAPLILFLDDDVEAVPDLIEVHLRFHRSADDPLRGVLGRVDWHPDLDVTTFMRWLDRSGLQFGYDTWLRPGSIDPPYAAFYTANISLHRELLERAGGFDERFPYPAYEDMELAWRLTGIGFRLEYVSDALVFHTRAIDLDAFRARMRRVAESAALLAAIQPEFPVDLGPARWDTGHPVRRRVLGAIAHLTRSEKRLAAYYRAEIAAAYREGLRHGRAVLRESYDGG